jgi:hypothetical protein
MEYEADTNVERAPGVACALQYVRVNDDNSDRRHSYGR